MHSYILYSFVLCMMFYIKQRKERYFQCSLYLHTHTSKLYQWWSFHNNAEISSHENIFLQCRQLQFYKENEEDFTYNKRWTKIDTSKRFPGPWSVSMQYIYRTIYKSNYKPRFLQMIHSTRHNGNIWKRIISFVVILGILPRI